MARNKQIANEAVEANQAMSEKFKDYDSQNFSAADSEAESANQKIQQSFYKNNEDNNFLPFQIESGSPPIKKSSRRG